MSPILVIGTTLFTFSAIVIFVTMKASNVADLQRKRRKNQRFLNFRNSSKTSESNEDFLSDHKKLEKSARKIEGTKHFF